MRADTLAEVTPALREVEARLGEALAPFQAAIEQCGLKDSIVPASLLGRDDREYWQPFLVNAEPPPPERMAIHWCNSWMRSSGYNPERPIAGSFYWQLLREYELI